MSEGVWPWDETNSSSSSSSTPSYDSYDQAEMVKLMRQQDLADAGFQALGGIGGGGPSFLDLLSSAAGGIKGGASDLAKMLFTTPRGIGTLLAMIYGARNARPDMGGGVALNLSPAKVTRTVVPAKYGPVMKTEYAADGGLMQAYAMGGVVTGTPRRPMQMEDGGFVMTKAAVDGAGGPQGLAQSVPGSQLIVGPGDGSGKDDRVHAKIGNTTPARVSAGEMYVPKAAVDRAGGAKTLYALMNQLQRRA